MAPSWHTWSSGQKKKTRANTRARKGKKGKVTKKGAYKKGKKANFARRRAPVVETKRKDDNAVRAANFFAGGGSIDAILPDRTEFNIYDTEHTLMDPSSFLCWSQGLDQSQHIGQAVNVKYTNMKIQVRFPQPSVETGIVNAHQIIPSAPQSYELVWGWVPASLQLTGSTTPAANTVTLTQIRNHMNHRITDYFNARKDRLNFIPKKDSTIRIIGRKKVRPDMRRTSTLPPASADGEGDVTVGSIPDYFTEITWNHKNKKIWLEQTGNFNAAGDLIAMYPNYTWLPFCVLVNWNWEDIEDADDGYNGKKLECPSMAWNSITYFSDS